MNRAVRVALIAGAGYLIGRRRKLALTLALGAAAATGRASANPGGLLGRGAELLRSSPQLGRVAELGAPLAAAGRAAVSSVAMSTVDSVGERLRDRTESLRQAESGRAGPARERRDEEDRDRGGDGRERYRDRGDDDRDQGRTGGRDRPARPVARRSSGSEAGAPVRRRGR